MAFQHPFSAGYFYSFKNKRIIELKSLLERDYFLTLEFDDSIKQYQERPFQISSKFKNKKVSYTPDCLITFKNPAAKSILQKLNIEKIYLAKKGKASLIKYAHAPSTLSSTICYLE